MIGGRRIDCPVEWCRGDWWQHGGEGQHPEDWVHEDAHGFELPHAATLSRDQEGTRPVNWQLHMRWEGATFAVRYDTDPTAIAGMLREVADAIEAIAVRTRN